MSSDTRPAAAGAATAPAQSLPSLALGALGVVFGEIGTSPLFAMREALRHTRAAESPEFAVLGVVSLVIWTLTLIVTIKYIVFLTRADNRGEGGTLALMSLAQSAVGRRTGAIFALGVVGAALFYGESLIEPAISVLSAVEGVRGAPQVGHSLAPHVVPIAGAILIVLFLLQARGTRRVAAFFGPITALWFLALGALGVLGLRNDLGALRALDPTIGARFLMENGFLGFVILGGVFLAVTGAEALYADMGHFGPRPIRLAWFVLVFPCIVLNYLGQGAIVLTHPHARANPFWAMTPVAAYWPILILATLATVIASQAMISGAFSMTQQAVQLGLLPRIDIRRTSESQAGQIYVPSVNLLLMLGVLLLLLIFRSSGRLAAAYGTAVTGAMLVDSLLALFVVRRLWKWGRWQTAALFVPILLIDVTFVSSNLLKIRTGAWLPLFVGSGVFVIMWTWAKGSRILFDKTRRDSLPLKDLIDMLSARPPYRAPGTAVFPTSDPDMTPVALMHNLKHNKMLHERNVILTVRTAEAPRVPEAERVSVEAVNPDFTKVLISYGFMESPDLPTALDACRAKGVAFDPMSTSYYLGRRSLVAAAHSGMPLWQDKLFILLMRNATNPTDFFQLPPGRVVELGAQLSV